MRCSVRPLRTLASSTAPIRHRFAPTAATRRSFSSSYDDIEEEIPRLARQPLHPLSLSDLVKHGRPPLSSTALLASANFSLSLIPIRLAHRLRALRNLPYIVVSNPNIARILNNYRHSLSTLLPWQRHGAIASLDDEIAFTQALAELVQTHQDTIPVLAQGFLECRRYITPQDVTAFLDAHLRARIGTRLIAEQHIALHFSSQPFCAEFENSEGAKDPIPPSEAGVQHSNPSVCSPSPPSSYIGVVDTALRPASLIDSCGGFVAEICELKYGVRPTWRIGGRPDATLAFVPMHLEYIVTELLKNAFRAVVENGAGGREPVEITIAPEPARGVKGVVKDGKKEEQPGTGISGMDENAPGVTIRIRDRGGGVAPDVLPNIWSYSFTTFSDEKAVAGAGAGSDGSGGGGGGSNSTTDGLNFIAGARDGAGSIAGLGYGLPLSRAYAEFLGGSIEVQSLYGWGTDVYLRLKGVGT